MTELHYLLARTLSTSTTGWHCSKILLYQFLSDKYFQRKTAFSNHDLLQEWCSMGYVDQIYSLHYKYCWYQTVKVNLIFQTIRHSPNNTTWKKKFWINKILSNDLLISFFVCFFSFNVITQQSKTFCSRIFYGSESCLIQFHLSYQSTQQHLL